MEGLLPFPVNASPLINNRDGIYAHYDFSDLSKLWFDPGRTTKPTNGGTFQVCDPEFTRVLTDRQANQSSISISPRYHTNVQNSLSVARFDDDTLNFASTRAMAQTVFIVCQSDSVDTNILISNDGRNRLSIDLPFQDYNAGVTYEDYGQFARFEADNVDLLSPVDHTKSKLTNFRDWNILEMVKTGPSVSLAVNGDFYTTGNLSDVQNSIEQIVGTLDIGEILIYNRPLSEGRRNVIRQDLATKWAVTNIQNHVSAPEPEIIVVLDSLGLSDDDYFMNIDGHQDGSTVHLTFTQANTHNSNIDATDRIAYGTFDLSGNQLTPLETVAGDNVPSNLNITNSGMTYLSDGRIVSVYGRREIGAITTNRQLYFKIRSTGGVWGTETQIDVSSFGTSNPDWLWAMAQQGPIVEGGVWYLPCYGNDNTSSSDPYQIRIIKSTDEGISWSEVLFFDGATHSPQISPEEPQLQKLSNGNFLMLIREDINKDIYSWQSINIENWNLTNLKYAFEGANFAKFREFTDIRKVVVSNRLPTHGNTISYVVSHNYGDNWDTPIELMPYRNDNNWRHMGGFPVDVGNGKIGIYQCTDNGTTGGYSNLLFKIIHP